MAVFYFVAVERFYPHDAFSLDTDEGINAIKALLLEHGYRLYDPVWNDQPPPFTHLLRGWFRLFGWDLVSGRLLTLLFAALLVFAIYDLVRRCWSHGAALVAVLLLLSSTYFIALSVALMIGLPSLACAMLSLWALVRWRSADRWGWLFASAMLMSGSLGIKLFTAFLVPCLPRGCCASPGGAGAAIPGSRAWSGSSPLPRPRQCSFSPWRAGPASISSSLRTRSRAPASNSSAAAVWLCSRRSCPSTSRSSSSPPSAP